MNMSESRVRQMCRSGKLRGAKKTAGIWALPLRGDPRLSDIYFPEHLTKQIDPSAIAGEKKDQALKRLGLVKQFEKFSAQLVRSGKNRTDAVKIFCKQEGISQGSLYRWIRDYRRDGLEGLIDNRGGRYRDDIITEEAFEYFKSLYLDEKRLSLRQCLIMVEHLDKRHSKGWKIPSLSSMRRLVKDRIPKAVLVRYREGKEAYEAKCAPYIQTDIDSIEPGDIWVGDHHQFNCFIRHRGKWVRPWLTAWQDSRSRAVVGFYVSTSPNQTTILQATRRAIVKHGPPSMVKIDNGRDYDSQMWTGVTKAGRKKRRALDAGYIDETHFTGLYGLMGIDVSFAQPYHPQAKKVERFFDTLDMQFTKTFDTYCGKHSRVKPEKLQELLKAERAIKNANNLETFEQLLGEYIEVYNNSAHSGEGMNGQTPNEVLSSRVSVRRLADGVLDLLTRVWTGELKVGKNGIRIHGVYYGQYDAALMQYQGRVVRASYDPDDMSRVWVYCAGKMEFVAIAEQAQLVGYGSKVDEEDLRKALRQKAKAKKFVSDAVNKRLTASSDLTRLAIMSARDRTREAESDDVQKNIKPVRTPLDGQVTRHRRREIQRAVKKAAGAEGTTHIIDLDIPIGVKEEKPKKPLLDLGLFD